MSPAIRRITVVGVLALGAFAAGCAVNPATGKKEFTLVSPAQEAQMGREGFTAAVAEFGEYDDAALAAYVDSVGRRVARASDQPNAQWKFTLLDDPVVNAFAMPGGYIFVTRGLLAHMQSEAQLAGVLGHEVAHVTARHSARQITQTQLASLGLGIASAVSPTFRRHSGMAEQALGLFMLKHSRDDETQADDLGVRYETTAGYDPRQMPGTYRTLQRIGERSGQSLPVYLSTHPDPGARAERTAGLAAKAAAGKTNLLIKERGYLERLRNMVYGENPRYGWFEGSHFYHPVLGLELTFPNNWKTSHSHTALTAMAPDESGAMQMTIAPNSGTKSPADYVVALTTEGRIAGSRGGTEQLGPWSAWVGNVSVPDGKGGSGTLTAAWVRVSSQTMLQVLGRGAQPGNPAERQILASIRTMTQLVDPRRGMVQPVRLRITPSPAQGPFREVYASLGSNLIPLDEMATLNGIDPDETVMRGQWLKVVDAPRW